MKRTEILRWVPKNPFIWCFSRCSQMHVKQNMEFFLSVSSSSCWRFAETAEIGSRMYAQDLHFRGVLINLFEFWIGNSWSPFVVAPSIRTHVLYMYRSVRSFLKCPTGPSPTQEFTVLLSMFAQLCSFSCELQNGARCGNWMVRILPEIEYIW